MTHNDTLQLALRYIREMEEAYPVKFQTFTINAHDPGLVFFYVTIYRGENTIPFYTIARSLGITIYSRRKHRNTIVLSGKIYGRKIKTSKS